MAFTLNERGDVVSKRVFADSSDLMKADAPGLPDGMRVTPNGTIFATAPGGVLIMDSNGKRLGRIRTGSAIANCAFGDDGRTLYMTSHKFLARIRLNIQGIR
jgi:gluconolactonase